MAFVSSTNELGSHVSIYRGVKIKKSSVGDYSYISAHTDVENATIGKFCSVADHCRIGLASHTLHYLSTSPIFTIARNAARTQWVDADVDGNCSKKVVIGNDVWIGSHALILGGVTVGDGAVIGAGAVVISPSYSWSLSSALPP